MVESETYRFQDVCSRELLVKILSEEVCFQAGFEGRGGKAVTKNEGKRTADLCSREAEGTTTMLFSFKGGDAKSSIIRRRSQRPRRDVGHRTSLAKY